MVKNETSKIRSKIMSSVKSSGTVIETKMREIMEEVGVAYEEHPKGVYGNPDFIVPDKKAAVFCDGDFWHGFEFESNPRLNVKKNRKFWLEKIGGNIRRDFEVNLTLRKNGWKVLRFWEHDITRHPEEVREKIRRELLG
jgi:DNA mismatch endonuclease (patch repair protein)